jgi:TolB-like protein/Tfp pilus assembly protein PilF
MLLGRAGEPVTKDQLFATIWRGSVVTDDALTSCIRELRKALGDDAKQPRFIETRHRRGYRFIAAVAGSSGEAASGPRRFAEPSGKPVVAVLPFQNMSGDPEQEYFADAITDDLITALSKHRSLFVIARTSTFAFKEDRGDVRRIGMDLGADYVVEGSVSKIGGHLRIRAQLVETETGRHVWAERYDREVMDIFQVQDDLTAAIAGRIEPEIAGAERTRAAKRPRQSLRAWDLFHLGVRHFYKSTKSDNLEAQQCFRGAIELDSSVAEAYAWLSYSILLTMIYFDAEPDEARLDEALSIAAKAVALDDQDAITHFAYGRALLARKTYRDALAELELAVALNPALAMAYCGLGDSLAYEGRFDEAIPQFERAIHLSPYDPQRWAFHSYRALAHVLAREFEHALGWAERATLVPNCHYWPFAHRVAALGHLRRRQPAAVAELLDREPSFSCRFAQRRLFYIRDPAQLELYVEGLRRAGVSES